MQLVLVAGTCHSEAPIPTCWNGLFPRWGSLKHKSLHSSHCCCLQGPHSKWKLRKIGGQSRTRLSPYPRERTFLHSYKPALTGFTLLTITTASFCPPCLASQSHHPWTRLLPTYPQSFLETFCPTQWWLLLSKQPLFTRLEACSKHEALCTWVRSPPHNKSSLGRQAHQNMRHWAHE